MSARAHTFHCKRRERVTDAQKIAELEGLIQDLEHIAADLAQQISEEEKRTGVLDKDASTYSTFAWATGQRILNLRSSIKFLEDELGAAIADDGSIVMLDSSERMELPAETTAAPSQQTAL